MSNMPGITLAPIGHVQSRFTDWAPSEEMRQHRSELIINKDLTPGLDGLSAGDCVLVLFYCHMAHGYVLRRHPRDDQSSPERGVFALRSQYRPNPIGATIAQIEDIRGNVVHVTGLDALDGSPLLDIKPYVPTFDAPGTNAQESIATTFSWPYHLGGEAEETDREENDLDANL